MTLISHQNDIYQVGGSLTFNHPTYVDRKADQELLNALEAGKFCYVFNCRQMGKSSLRVRAMHQLQAKGMACASVDITSLGSDINQSQWYSGLISQLFLGFNLIGKINLKVWLRERENISPVQKLNQFLEEVVLTYCTQEKIFIFIDEIDKVLSLPFSLDDFFSLIRYFYNQRAENPIYNRLTFALFGVATPSNLIREKTQTPFNIGHAIELTGFTLAETAPLQQGLLPIFDDPKIILSEILHWTGGQPFLTQKVCNLLFQEYANYDSSNPSELIKKVIQNNIIINWESQDEPVHLKTIRDRLFRQEEKAGRLLGIYQQILQEGAIKADDSPEQTELRLSGLVVKHQEQLVSYNKIYRTVFDLPWVNHQLEKIRPYSESINAWIASNYQDESRLLRGQALQDALVWSKDKSLGSIDYRFLTSSQFLEKKEADQSRKILEKAHKKATFLMRIGLGIFLISLVGTFMSFQQAKTARLGIELQKKGNNALSSFEFDQIGSLISAMQAGQRLKSLVNPSSQLQHYPTTTPILSLQQILDDIQEKNLIEAHKDAVTAVSLSPNANYLATTSWDGTAKLWDRQSRELQVLPETNDYLYDVAFSPDGQTLITTSEDGTAKRWNLQGELINRYKDHTDAVYRVAFSPDGQLVATTSKDQTARLWTVQGDALAVFQGHTKSVDDVAFTPDGKGIITASRDGTARLWDLKGNLIQTFSDNQIPLYSIAVSPDGKRIAAAAKDGTIKVWTIANKQLQTFEGHQKLVFRVRFSPDGQRILSASSDGTARIWDLQGKNLEILRVSQEPVTDIVMNGDLVATASQDGNVKLWQLDAPSDDEFSTLNRRVTSVAVYPQTSLIAVAAEGGTLSLWDFQGNLIQEWETEQNWIYDLNFSPDGQYVATASGDGKTQVWDLKGQKTAEFEGNGSRVYGVSFSPDGQLIAIAAKDGTVRIQDRYLNKEKQIFNAHDDWIYGIAFDPTGKRIATASKDKKVKIWNLQGNLEDELMGHQDIVTQVRFSPDGNYLLTASRDGTAILWDNQGKLLKILESNLFQVSAISFSPDSQTIATASTDGTVRLWDLGGNLRGEYKDQQNGIVSLDFSKDGQKLMTVNGTGSVRLWPVESEYEHLEELLGQGCDWLEDYLSTRPQKQGSLSVCQ